MKTVNIAHQYGSDPHLVNLYEHPQDENEDTQFICETCGVLATVYAKKNVKPPNRPMGNYQGGGGLPR